MRREHDMPTLETPPPFPRRPETSYSAGRGGRDGPPRQFTDWLNWRPRGGGPLLLMQLVLAMLVIYAAYFWFERRVGVGPHRGVGPLEKGGRRRPGRGQAGVPAPKNPPRRPPGGGEGP